VENENREVSGDDTDEDGEGASSGINFCIFVKFCRLAAKPAQPAKKKEESSSDSDD
jgi:hypothetical protein